MPVSIAAARARALFTDNDGDGQPDPGDIFLHTITITNSGDTDATAVVDTESENGLTIDPGSVKIGPIAGNDVFNITGNTPITFSAAQLLGNDVDPDGPEASLAISSLGAATNGTLVDNGNGTYTFTPNTGFTGAASFTYGITDAQGLTSVVATPGVVTFNVSGLVWYVDSAAAAGGDGSFANPFQSLTPLSTGGAADGLDGAGDTIFVYDRGASAYTTGIVLETSQTLRGDGVAFAVNCINIGATATNSTINHAGAAVTLASGNTIAGLDLVGTSSAAVGIVDGGASVGTLTVGVTSITGQGQIIDIDQGGTIGITLGTASSTGSTGANGGVIDLNAVQGTFTVSGATSITGTHGQTGIDITAASGTLAVALQGNTTLNLGTNGALNFSGNTTGASSLSLSGTSKDVDTTSGAALTFTGNTGTTVSITNGGLDVDTTSGTGLSLGGGTLVVSGAGNTINTTTGQIFVAANAAIGAGNVTFVGLGASGSAAGNAIDIDNLDGNSFNGGTVAIAGSTGDAINLRGGSSSTFNFGATTIDGAGGDGIELNGANGTVTFSSVDIDGVGAAGANIVGATNAVNIQGGTIGLGNDPAGDGVIINGGTAGISIAANLTKTSAGNIVEIANHSVGTITLSGTLSATGGVDNGILLNNNASGTITFSGASKLLSTAANNAVNILANGAAVQFANGGLDIDTTSGTGLNAAGAGTLLINGADNSVTATTGRAIGIDGPDSAGITLRDVSANGGTSTAIFLNNAGTGGFTITGTGSTAGSGGTIQNRTGGATGDDTAGIGVYVGNTGNVALSNMNFTGPFGNFAIKGETVSNFTLRDSTSSDAAFTIGSVAGEGVIRFENLSGVGLFEGNNLSGAFQNTLSIVNSAGTLNLFVRDSASDPAVFGRNNTSNGDDHIFVETQNDADLLMLVDGVQFGGNSASGLGWRGDAINTNALGTSSHEVTVRNSVFDNNHSNIVPGGGIGVLIAGTANAGSWGVDYTVQNNIFTGSSGYAIAASFNGGPGTARGFISGNTIGTDNGIVDTGLENTGSNGGAGGIFVSAERTGATSGGTLAHYATISNNTIRDIFGGAGIFVRAVTNANPEFATVEATINNNNVDEVGGNAFAAFRALAAGNDPDASRVGLDVNNNVFNADTATGAAPGNTPAYGAVMLDQAPNTAGFYYLPGYGDPPFNGQDGELYGGTGSTTMETYLLGRGNTLTNPPAPLSGFPDREVYANDARMNGGTLQPAQTGSNTQLPTGAMMAAPPSAAAAEAATATALPGEAISQAPNPLAWLDDYLAADLWVSPRLGGGRPLPAWLTGRHAEPTPAQAAPVPPAAPANDPGAAPPVEPPSLSPIVDDGVLSEAELDFLAEAAVRRWIAAGATPEQAAAMRATAIEIADMTGLYLGTNDGETILIDSDGGGQGWFLDPTPGDDSEYAGSGSRLAAAGGGDAESRIDLLTVLMHELGHRIGLADDHNVNGADALMYGYAHLGERRLPQAGDVAAAGTGPVGHEAFVLVLPTVGTLPAGKAVQIRFNSTVNNFSNQVIPDFNNVSTVSGGNFPNATSSAELLDVDSLTLGNLVFFDANANGLFDGGDSGIDGIALTLFADDGDGVLDGGDSAIATATTAGGGLYSFINLAPGNYIVRVDAANFASGAPLDGRVTATGGADPDDNVDSDDNGTAGAGGVVASPAITLSYNGETLADGTGRLDINDRLDFGFATLNTAPVNTVGAAVSLNEDAVAVDVGAGVSVADAEADSAGADISVTFEVTNGTLAIRTDVGGGILLADISFQDADRITVVATSAAINATLAAAGGLTYSPDADFNGSDVLTITTSDLGVAGLDPGSTGTATDERDVDLRALDVASVNDAPAGADDSIAAVEGVAYQFHNVDFGFTDPADGDALLEVIVNGVANGTLYLDVNSNGPEAGEEFTTFPATISATAIAAGQLLFVPDVGATTASLAFQVRDGGGTANGGIDLDASANTLDFSVAVANAPAVAVDDADNTDENLGAAGNVFDANPTTADSDPDGPPLQVSAVNGSGAQVGNVITLPSGAILTLNADGSYSYNPNGRYDYLITPQKAADTGAVNTSASDSFSYALLNGNTATVTVTIDGVDSAGDQLRGDAGNNVISGVLTPERDFFDLSQGGDDTATGGSGKDAFYMGGAMTSADIVDGGPGDDQLGLQGDYSGGLTLNPGVVVETIVPLSGTDLRFGDPGGNLYSYAITTDDGNVGAGAKLTINANQLQPGENLVFDGSAETDGGFTIITGAGDNDLTGGAQSDGFFFGEGAFDAGDVVDGGAGADDQVGLFGNFTIMFTATQLTSIETIVPLSGPDRGAPFFSYDLTMDDGNVAPGERMTVNANQLKSSETLTLDGSAESDGSFRLIGGAGDDRLIGSQNGDLIFGSAGDDLITGGGGLDTLTGMAGDDSFIFTDKTDSPGLARDVIADFSVGDLIDLSGIDADETSAAEAFSFLGVTPFGNAPGQLRAFENAPGQWFVEGDVDGNGIADFAIEVHVADGDPITAGDFVL